MSHPPPSHPTTRVLAMLELLQANQRIGGAELARRLGVDERTVRRYAARLEDLGVPVTAERGRHGGYRLMPGYKLPPLMLTDDEATAVVLGLLAGRRIGLAGQATESALAKVERVLPAALRDRVQALRDTLGFTAPARDAAARGAAPDTGAVLTLAAAARERRRVRLRYRSFRGADTERDLDPYGLVFHSGRWYVTGHDHRSGEIRTFRIDRVASAEPGTARFEPPAGLDPVQHVTRSLAAVPYAHEVEVLLETTIAEARRRIPAATATLAEDAGGVLLTTRAERLDGMARMLAGLGFPFVIRRPGELRGHVRDLARSLQEQAVR
ncbi:helix-turn-helix transcriptional regulator [Actinomadura madurae]|uniref:helix-turn-helix transcriptional regulator n=1 Tax=Actinomadura madurae TaxID=1993 RepID=UPI0020D2523C|nr:YafY family protein [Actinomadura madurae]MCP9947587.1 YafY family transcriptional regulator [Actinomadura madurae]MCP9964350.1 YafY family transcriptional regulator [Actinomadura madurae]MCP9976835.1 YafY family transcriptional regulator [Actinomadura madurae]MCQ0011677.1 YafY family transcriptional regulator [Actinomadura madurae]MCQ0013017.1 YafY family transcriptional regulator [Actinomadura madurae]